MPRRGAAEGFAIDVATLRTAARGAALVWLCSPNNPTGLPEPPGAVADLLLAWPPRGRRPPPAARRRPRRGLRRVAEAPSSGCGPPTRVVVVRTASKAYALAGLRVGFAIARPSCWSRWSRTGRPGRSPSPRCRRRRGPPRSGPPGRQRGPRGAERARLASAFEAAGLPAHPSLANFLSSTSWPSARPRHGRGPPPARARARTFGADIPSPPPPLHRPRPVQDDRLIAAFADLAPAVRGAAATTQPAPRPRSLPHATRSAPSSSPLRRPRVP